MAIGRHRPGPGSRQPPTAPLVTRPTRSRGARSVANVDAARPVHVADLALAHRGRPKGTPDVRSGESSATLAPKPLPHRCRFTEFRSASPTPSEPDMAVRAYGRGVPASPATDTTEPSPRSGPGPRPAGAGSPRGRRGPGAPARRRLAGRRGPPELGHHLRRDLRSGPAVPRARCGRERRHRGLSRRRPWPRCCPSAPSSPSRSPRRPGWPSRAVSAARCPSPGGWSCAGSRPRRR